MKHFTTLITKARHSAFYRAILSFMLGYIVPFNRPHGFKVLAVTPQGLTVKLPYHRANRNHLRGLHACALATLAELTTGTTLLMLLDSRRYRLILQELRMEYHYQGRSAAVAIFDAPQEWLNEKVIEPLNHTQKITVPCIIKLYDAQQNHLATGTVYWQLKDWKFVKTA